MAGFWSAVQRRAELTPHAEMLVDEHTGRLSFAGFRDRAERVSSALVQHGAGEGVPVTWQLPTGIDALVLTAALARLGAVQNPVITSHGGKPLEFVPRQTPARLPVAAES